VVSSVSSSGQIEPNKAEELSKRVDELEKHLTEERDEEGSEKRGKDASEKRGEDAVNKVDDLDKYLAELSQKGDLSREGAQQIEGALQTVRDAVAEG